ncbi:MBOAT family O-acyltransferase [Spirosoma rhododendri]|uniref:MBOAT family protein n=1 Tax=Spirosoma rhododendri TaxID=2728024 RepID=A0A7L5DPB0_9BACT|nr:MBOAT family protein [Spirosoma rhododendri]QJD77570.1 MBOAT family protein [Spirosoma rhododendri]
MLFTSPEFALLVICTFVLYYLPPLRRYQVPILIAASLYFYAYGQADLLWLLLLSVSINIASSYLVIYGRADRHHLYAVLGVVFNLLILIFFKYGPLLGQTFATSDSGAGAWLASLPLPIGISFFTFQGISLVVDTYKYRHVAEYRSLIARNLVKHAQTVLFFKGFFPQLVSGPIVKANFFLPQIGYKPIQAVRWEYCFRTLVLGYFLKMVVADNLKDHTMLMTYPYFEAFSSVTLITLLLGYSMQIFADFAGYSLIALGLAAVFGYQFPINFNFPYVSTSFADFWRRWHISLSSFLREYLYIPLGGNRHGQFRTYTNLLLTMVLGGLWHGAAWSYAVWGLAHGLALALERLAGDTIGKAAFRGFRLLRGLLVFSYITLAWLLFRLPNFDHVLAYLRAIVANINKPHETLAISFIVLYSIPVVLYHLHYLLQQSASYQLTLSRGRSTRMALAYGLLLFLIITNSGSGGAFIYFQF